MSDTRRVRFDPKRVKCVMSTAASEAFGYLNALTKSSYRGWGDTATAARDRVAREVGISPAQAERVWKRWQSMASIDGDVYRALRNRYEAICEANEKAADAMRAERQSLRADRHATVQKPASAAVGGTSPRNREDEETLR